MTTVSRNLPVKIRAALVTGCLLVLFARASEARATYRFGKEESIHKIKETDIRDAEGHPLDLAYKVTTFNFFAGVSVHDDGYVLQSRDNTRSYYSLPPEKIATYQAAGRLPNPLPKYSLSFFDYLFGYSLWIIAGVVICVVVWSSIKKKTRQKQVATSTGSPAPSFSPASPQANSPPPPGSTVVYKPDSCLENILFYSGFLGFAAALGGSAAERLWFLVGCAAVLFLLEIGLMTFGPPRRWVITVRVIAQLLLWAIFITAVRH
jgi:hypothetical protein